MKRAIHMSDCDWLETFVLFLRKYLLTVILRGLKLDDVREEK